MYFQQIPKIDDRKGHVIEAVATKQKTDPLFLSKLIKEGGIPAERLELVHTMHRSGLDFRQLLKFKHALFQGEEAITPSTKMPESVFKQMSAGSDLPQIRKRICGCENQILK